VKIQNLKTMKEPPSGPASMLSSVSALNDDTSEQPAVHQDASKPELEVAFLRARIQHLELVIETARGLLGSNQDRLLRRLCEVPRDLVSITTQLQRLDPHTRW
jgi:hypothetical protein